MYERVEPVKEQTLRGDEPEKLLREQLARCYASFKEEGMERVRKVNMAVVGCGGVGSWAAVMLIRSGIAKIRLIDFDRVTMSSLNRHATATLSNVGTSKVQSMKSALMRISLKVEVDAREELWRKEDGASLLEGVDWVIGLYIDFLPIHDIERDKFRKLVPFTDDVRISCDSVLFCFVEHQRSDDILRDYAHGFWYSGLFENCSLKAIASRRDEKSHRKGERAPGIATNYRMPDRVGIPAEDHCTKPMYRFLMLQVAETQRLDKVYACASSLKSRYQTLLPLIDAVSPVLDDDALVQQIRALSSGDIAGPLAVSAGSPLSRLLEVVATIIHPTARVPLETNRNPCELCSRSHQRCVLVSAADQPKLCRKCRGRGLAQCAQQPNHGAPMIEQHGAPMIEQQAFVPATLMFQPEPAPINAHAQYQQLPPEIANMFVGLPDANNAGEQGLPFGDIMMYLNDLRF